jgi:pimeloyl-ACP methyl ester carboxylesterase
MMRVKNAGLYYEEQGSGSQTLVFAHGLFWSCRMFDEQVALLQERYRCIAFDFRGQGQSEVNRDGYDLETLSEDAAALIETLQCAPYHFVGLSMGGYIGLRLAARRPELLRSLILLGSSADPEPAEQVRQFRLLFLIARWLGPGLVMNQAMPVLFGQKFLQDPARAELRGEWQRRLSSNHRVGAFRAAMGVITRKGVRDELGQIRVPTLILVGDQDVGVPLPHSQRLHEGIAGSQLVVIPGAGHTSTVEEPAAVTAAISEFLERYAGSES